MTMTMVRQDDTPARRRYRHERLAVLALLALGSNLGCSREILRMPAGPGANPASPPPMPPMAVLEGRPKGPGHVALRVEYGSTLDELFPVTYRNPASYGPQLASRPAAGPAEGRGAKPVDLLAACETTRIPPPARRPPASLDLSPPRHDDPRASAFEIAHIPPPRARRPSPATATLALAGPRAGSPSLVEASAVTRIPLPKRPRARGQLPAPDLTDASAETGIAMPVAPAGRRKPETAARTVVLRSDGPGASPPPPARRNATPEDVGAALEATNIAPPIPPMPRPEPVAGDLDAACKVTRIPPPASAPPPRRSEDKGPDGLPPPPRQVDPSLFQMSHESTETPPPPAEPPRRDERGPDTDLIAACEKTRIAPPKSPAEPGRLPPPE